MNVVKLGDVAKFIRGVTFRPDDVAPLGTAGSIACFRTRNVQGELDTDDVWAIPRGLARGPEKLLRPGDILVSTANSWNLVGKCCWIPQLDYEATLGGFISALRCNDRRVSQRYLFHWFGSNEIQAVVRSCARQTTNISNLSIERCLGIPLPLPSLRAQEHIAAFLDAAIAVRRKRQKTLGMLGSLSQSFFFDLFGDPLTNSRKWPPKRVVQIAKVITGNTPPRSNREYYGSAIEWIKSDNLNTSSSYVTRAEECLSQLGKTVARLAPAGSLLVTCIAGTPSCIGNVAITDREVAFNQQINALIPLKDDVRFLYMQFLLAQRLVQDASTGGMKGLVSKSRFESIELIAPPLELQVAFGYRFDEAERSKVLSNQSLAALERLFTSLEHRAFSGELTSTGVERELEMVS